MCLAKQKHDIMKQYSYVLRMNFVQADALTPYAT